MTPWCVKSPTSGTTRWCFSRNEASMQVPSCASWESDGVEVAESALKGASCGCRQKRQRRQQHGRFEAAGAEVNRGVQLRQARRMDKDGGRGRGARNANGRHDKGTRRDQGILCSDA